MHIKQFEVEDKVPDEGEIKHLCNNRSKGTSRMRAEHLKGWLTAARRGEKVKTNKEGGGQEDTQEWAEN